MFASLGLATAPLNRAGNVRLVHLNSNEVVYKKLIEVIRSLEGCRTPSNK